MDLTDLTKVTAKLLANEMQVNIKTAESYLKDIREHFTIKIVTMWHVKQYLKIE